MMSFDKDGQHSFSPWYPLSKYASPLDYRVYKNSRHRQIAVLDLVFSTGVLLFCILAVSGLFVMQPPGYLMMLVAFFVVRLLSAWLLWADRTQNPLEGAVLYYQFDIYTLRWLFVNLSAAMLYATVGRAVDDGLGSVLMLLTMLHSALLLMPIWQGSHYLITVRQTKKPIRS
jgi:hypothetical protein